MRSVFWVLPLPVRQVGFEVVELKFPLSHDENVQRATAPAVRRTDSEALAPLGIPVPLPVSVAVILPEAMGCPGPFWQVVLLKRAQVTVAAAGPVVLMLMLPSVNVVVTVPDSSP